MGVIVLIESKKLVQYIASVCEDKLAKDIIVLDMNQVSLIADYFLICQGSNERQVQSIAKAIRDSLGEKEVEVRHMEGVEHGRWIVVDVGNIVCHIFHEDERSYYNLERLWGDASEVKLEIGQEG